MAWCGIRTFSLIVGYFNDDEMDFVVLLGKE